jgi:7-carboxy-7-deazaguanine synthase
MPRELAMVSTDRVFYTLQGEGPLMGMPALFVRLDNCNLKCRWGETLCDAHYTSWTPSGEKLAIDALVAEVHAAMQRHKVRHLVITGGEPALQPEVVRALTARGHPQVYMGERPWHITIETNGTRYVEHHGLDLVCISPKLSSSTPVGTKFEEVHERNRWNPIAIRRWMLDESYYFKFVIDTPQDVDEVLAGLEEVGQPLVPERVLFMPQGIDSKTLWERGRWVAEECKRLGVRFAPRIQVDLWGNTPGT